MVVISLRMRDIASIVMIVSILLFSCSSKDDIVKVSAVSLDKSQIILVVDEEINLYAVVSPVHAENKSLRWTSFDETVATVSSDGKITAIAPGETFINVVTVDGNFKKSCRVIVKAKFVKVSGISISNQKVEIKIGYKQVLIAEVTPKNATNSKIIWNSSHPDIVFVSDKGIISGLKLGEALISAKSSDGGFVATCNTKVLANNVTGIFIDETDIKLVVGNSGLLVAKCIPENSTSKEIIWSSLNPDIANVKDGVVTALKVGNTKIYATSKDGGFKVFCNVTVNPVHVESIYFSTHRLSVAKNSKIELNVNVIPINATLKDVVFKSEDSDIVSVLDNNILFAHSEGEVVIIAESVDGAFSDRISINVESTFKDSFENIDYSNSLWTFKKLGEAKDDNNSGFQIVTYNSVDDDVNPAHSGVGGIVSNSYVNMQGPVHADNWIISPKLIVSDDSSSASFWVKSFDGKDFDGYEVYVCVLDRYSSIADFIKIKNFAKANDKWDQVKLDLSKYIGKKIYFAIRHIDFDNYMLLFDDFTLPPIAK